MKTAVLLASLTLAACASRADTPGSDFKAMPDEPRASSTLPAELAIAHPALLRAWQGKNAMAMRPYYTNEAVVTTRTERYSGWQQLYAGWLTPTLQHISNFMAMPSTFARQGEKIVEQGRYTFRIVKDGREDDVSGVYAQEWQKQDNGQWRIISASVISDQN